ncbi:MAG: ATP-binding cassette domain-containing protein [Chitinophagaceae bacterium]
MTISLSDAGKRFNREWIFRHITYTFDSGNSYAIIGPNGSGKSTLLQVISGSMYFNEGSVQYAVGSRQLAVDNRQLAIGNQESSTSGLSSAIKHPSSIPAESIYKHVSYCAPYLEVVEEMTFKEFLEFHSGFKPLLKEVTIDSIIATVGLEAAANKQIRYYSSGMKQRVKLAQCIFSDTSIVLLDEPCTNLDTTGIDLYHRLIDTYCKNRLVLVSSNDEVEYRFCREKLMISNYK